VPVDSLPTIATPLADLFSPCAARCEQVHLDRAAECFRDVQEPGVLEELEICQCRCMLLERRAGPLWQINVVAGAVVRINQSFRNRICRAVAAGRFQPCSLGIADDVRRPLRLAQRGTPSATNPATRSYISDEHPIRCAPCDEFLYVFKGGPRSRAAAPARWPWFAFGPSAAPANPAAAGRGHSDGPPVAGE